MSKIKIKLKYCGHKDIDTALQEKKLLKSIFFSHSDFYRGFQHVWKEYWGKKCTWKGLSFRLWDSWALGLQQPQGGIFLPEGDFCFMSDLRRTHTYSILKAGGSVCVCVCHGLSVFMTNLHIFNEQYHHLTQPLSLVKGTKTTVRQQHAFLHGETWGSLTVYVYKYNRER